MARTLVTIEFPDEETAEQWMSWHDNSGEQDHYTCCSERDEPKLTFAYNHGGFSIIASHVDEEE